MGFIAQDERLTSMDRAHAVILKDRPGCDIDLVWLLKRIRQTIHLIRVGLAECQLPKCFHKIGGPTSEISRCCRPSRPVRSLVLIWVANKAIQDG